MHYPATAVGDLYPARWRIAEAFKRIKHRLALEPWSGVSWLATQQDCGAKILGDNLHALAVYTAAPEPLIRRGRTGPTDQMNRTASIGLLKSRWQRWLLYAVPSFEAITAVLAEWLKNLVAVVPGASKPHLKGPKPHRHFAYQS